MLAVLDSCLGLAVGVLAVRFSMLAVSDSCLGLAVGVLATGFLCWLLGSAGCFGFLLGVSCPVLYVISCRVAIGVLAVRTCRNEKFLGALKSLPRCSFHMALMIPNYPSLLEEINAEFGGDWYFEREMNFHYHLCNSM
ncbi:hypothetical protein M5K25_019875 [Dendrobium thyrsiflorum]|uniref:Uncharacterized protein n=1 Tax=Dendrobium thyrsiflorum TaxID=117978 RepID=A0ABD0UGJ8_DENTH